MPKAASSSKRGLKEVKARRHKKDPKAPKRSLSAYMFFAQWYRDEVRQQNPDLGFGGIGKCLGEKWRNCNAKERERFEKMAQEDKERYEREKAQYNADLA